MCVAKKNNDNGFSDKWFEKKEKSPKKINIDNMKNCKISVFKKLSFNGPYMKQMLGVTSYNIKTFYVFLFWRNIPTKL